jgi:hypothetical protein
MTVVKKYEINTPHPSGATPLVGQSLLIIKAS